MCPSHDSQDTEHESFNYAILRRVTKIYGEMMVLKCPPQTLGKQLLDSFKTVILSRHACSFDMH